MNNLGNFRSHLGTHIRNECLQTEAKVLIDRLDIAMKDWTKPIEEINRKVPQTFEVSRC